MKKGSTTKIATKDKEQEVGRQKRRRREKIKKNIGNTNNNSVETDSE